jgi:hypothetical protein
MIIGMMRTMITLEVVVGGNNCRLSTVDGGNEKRDHGRMCVPCAQASLLVYPPKMGKMRAKKASVHFYVEI